jgi:preprotein translocase subunit SecG
LENTVLTLHVIACIALVLLILLQSGKEGMGVIFGGGSTSLFGGTGAGGILVKLTTIAALIFLGTSLGYNILSSAKMNKESSIINIEVDDPSAPPKPEIPAVPAGETPGRAPDVSEGTAPASETSAPAGEPPAAPSGGISAPAGETLPAPAEGISAPTGEPPAAPSGEISAPAEKSPAPAGVAPAPAETAPTPAGAASAPEKKAPAPAKKASTTTKKAPDPSGGRKP